MLRFVILGIIIFGLSGAFGANILVLEGLPSPSHHLFFRTVNEALVAQGHNVTSMSADIDTNPVANLTHLHNDKVYEEFYKTDGDEQFNMMNFGQNGNINTLIDKVEMFVATLAGVRKSKGYHQLLAYPDDFHFDLVIYDYMALPVLLGFQHKFKNPPLIIMSAFSGIAPTLNFVGSSLYPAYIPFYFGTSATETFFGRVENTFVYYFDYFYRQYYALPKIHAIAKQDFPDLPPFADLERQTRLAMINYSPAVYQPEPVLPNVIPIAGMHLQKTSTLPKDLQDILDHAQNGLILFSMGTNVKSWMLGEERIQKFIEAFRKLPQYTFLWKFDDDQLSNVPKNVIIRKWIPQNDVLTHPNTKLFMSHCGLLSSLESTWHGVPILAVPVFLDQFTVSRWSLSAKYLRLQQLLCLQEQRANAATVRCKIGLRSLDQHMQLAGPGQLYP
ncbi:UDP-glucosyltransferase 2-like [Phlebotomus argentipes]|uniref:UDP-glucosyltransferase 2-like n=1 Tax=Phlebotomus argentipes TaxID=94469 RepID=UPI002893134E|nr:UDP-glucosyltransferase 2-like [Phlebotomus argentipes]